MTITLRPIVWWFLGISAVFTVVHLVAMTHFFYWRFWWFDILMHSWGGVLIALGVHSLATLPNLPVRASYVWLLLALVIATISWEGFELYFGLFDPEGYMSDVSQDIVLAFLGGLLTHHLLLRYRMQ